jgi:hypothetical protein
LLTYKFKSWILHKFTSSQSLIFSKAFTLIVCNSLLFCNGMIFTDYQHAHFLSQTVYIFLIHLEDWPLFVHFLSTLLYLILRIQPLLFIHFHDFFHILISTNNLLVALIYLLYKHFHPYFRFAFLIPVSNSRIWFQFPLNHLEKIL